MTSSMSCSSAYAKLFLRYSQIPAEELLESTPLTPEDLEQQPFIGAENHRAIIHSLNQRMEDEAWAARSGGRFSINAHGPIGFAAMSAPTLGEALQVMVDFHDIRTNTFGAALDRRVTESTEGSERCRYRMWDLTDDVDYSRVLTESTIKILQSLIQAILGRDAIENFEVHFAWPAPAYRNELQKIYAAPCVFDSKFCGFEMSADLLVLRSSTYDETTYRNNLSQCHGLLEELQLSESTATRVQQFLSRHFDAVLAKQHQGHPPELGELAERMHVTSRTLIRRLKRDGTTYKQILEQLRRRYATELLLRTDLTAAAISELLGYGEPANFGRAFRRWYGTSPTQWRRKRE